MSLLKSERWKQQESFRWLLCIMAVTGILLTHMSLFKYEELTSGSWAAHYFELKGLLFETSYFDNWTYRNYARENSRLRQSTQFGKTVWTPKRPLSVAERLHQNKINSCLKDWLKQADLRYIHNGLFFRNVSAHREKAIRISSYFLY
jgi:hypothetical protein